MVFHRPAPEADRRMAVLKGGNDTRQSGGDFVFLQFGNRPVQFVHRRIELFRGDFFEEERVVLVYRIPEETQIGLPIGGGAGGLGLNIGKEEATTEEKGKFYHGRLFWIKKGVAPRGCMV